MQITLLQQIAIEYIKRMDKAFKVIQNSKDPKEIKKQIKQFKDDYEGLKTISENPTGQPFVLRNIIFRCENQRT